MILVGEQAAIKREEDLRKWAVEQSVKWRAATNGNTGKSSFDLAQEYYNFVKTGKKIAP